MFHLEVAYSSYWGPDEEYDALFRVIWFARDIGHKDAEDAALDAIRDHLNLGREVNNLRDVLIGLPFDSQLTRL